MRKKGKGRPKLRGEKIKWGGKGIKNKSEREKRRRREGKGEGRKKREDMTRQRK